MKRVLEWIIIGLSNVLIAIGFNWFLIPHQLLSGGASGVAFIIGYFTGWNIPMLYFLMNLPLLIWGLLVLGRRFIILSVISVILTSWLMTMSIFAVKPIAQNPMLGAVFGGILIGLGAGILLRLGGSSGGFDIVGSILTRKYDFPLGNVLSGLNGFVILALGYFKHNWDLALYSMLTIFIAGKMIDTIHIRHIKITAFIVTKNKEEMIRKLLQIPRGVTLIKAEGAYTNQPQDMLMTVTTRYELIELQKIIKEADPRAFVNIVETVGVLGEFRKTKE